MGLDLLGLAPALLLREAARLLAVLPSGRQLLGIQLTATALGSCLGTLAVEDVPGCACLLRQLRHRDGIRQKDLGEKVGFEVGGKGGCDRDGTLQFRSQAAEVAPVPPVPTVPPCSPHNSHGEATTMLAVGVLAVPSK